MALVGIKWISFQRKVHVCSLLVILCLHTAKGMSGWGGCLDGQDVFAAVRENSNWGEVIAELMTETSIEGVRWSLQGKDADWLFLDDGNIVLNTSDDRVLDREVQGPFLMAELSCYEDDILQSVYRVMVEILNENDHTPVFAENTLQSIPISELTPVDTVVFTVRATDEDDDKIIYSIDPESPDAEYFKIELPNSGEVVLAKPLDYETKTVLTVIILAAEMNTAEHHNISTTISINILDGDDQYPQFMPCKVLYQDETSRICTSPEYTANVTEGQEDIVLDFSPGPIYAVDGDRGINGPVSYVIISGDEDGHFLMDRETGEIKLIQGVPDKTTTPTLQLQIMAYQVDDPRKYSLATAVVRVLAKNQFHPKFEMVEYQGFVIAGKTHACLVSTYASKALMLHVQDEDFTDSFNPMVYFTFSTTSNHTDIYQITQDGLLIAKTNQLKPKMKHVLQVTATDLETGEATFATVLVEVLPQGHLIPLSPLSGRISGCTLGKAFFLSMVLLTVLGCVLSVAMWLKKKHKGKRNPLERGCVAQGKHPNVSLRWFQLLSHPSSMTPSDEVAYNNEEYGTCNPSFSFTDMPGTYTHQDLPSCRGPVPPRTTAAPDTSFTPTEPSHSPAIFSNNSLTPTKSLSSSPTFNPATADVSPTHSAQDPSQHKEDPDASITTSPNPTEALSITSPSPATHDKESTTPLTCLDSQTTQSSSEDPADPVTSPSSQSSIPCSHTRIAAAEIDKPFSKSRVKTPPYSPLLSSPLPKQTSTSPPTPAHAPLKAKLIHIDTSPLDTPPPTPVQTSVPQSNEEDQPSTSLDQPDQVESPGEPADGSTSEEPRPSETSADNQDERKVGDEDEEGFLGDEDADKNSEEDSELEPDDEELLRVMARCNPVFITFSK